MLEFNQSFRTRVTLHGKNHLDVADSLFCIGLTHSIKDELEMALQCFVECLKIRRTLLEGSSIKIADIQVHVGKILQELWNLDDAELCLKEALSIVISNHGKNYGAVADISFSLGIVLSEKGELSASLDFYNKALRISKNCKGHKSIEVANIVESIGKVYRDMGINDEAKNRFEEALHLKQDILGQDHEEIASILYFLGSSLLLEGKFNDSIYYLNKALILKQKNPKTNPLDLLTNLSDLGQAFEKVHEFQKALTCYDEAHKLRKFGGDELEWNIAETLHRKGHLHLTQNEKKDALNSFQETIEIEETILGINDGNRLGLEAGNVLRFNTRFLQLEKCYEDTLSLLKSDDGEKPMDITDILLMKGNLHARKREFAAAIDCYSDALKFLKVNITCIYRNLSS